ncbi:dihydrolipoamide dehydrogenase [Acetoanaerobium pronyense]|uniref:Dihydrolipoyl dehydrogenase n=1 Tax=Acetoanaerobium pronyense TaxID=1482736 RepID=A0ABS4KK62_9FIRM|nr:dihydrolipoyl dehydrogenase [Acetoanaerobium pronyense]MBP2028149.1 dihydrolipoamide dehydrogenase [Acetoanaerobium pronyense]
MNKDIIIEKLNGHDKEAIVGKLNKKSGDNISAGEVIMTVESSKGTFPIKSEFTGKILNLTISEGDTVKKGEKIGDMDADSSSSSNEKKQGYTFGIVKPIDKSVDVDLLVIGGGPGGYVAAIRGAQNGLKVALIEEDRLGGTCLNYGCIPTKAMISSVNIIESIKSSNSHGITVNDFDINLEKMVERKDSVVDQLIGGIEHLMNSNSIEYINGRAKVNEDKTIVVNTKKYNYKFTYKNLILALGSKVSTLPIEGADDKDILTNEELLNLKEIPKSLTIIGGGVIGMEFAFIYNSLGTKVNVIEYTPQILGLLDSDVADVIKDSAKEKGINIYENAKAVAIKNTLDGLKLLEVEIKGTIHHISSEKLAMATGRKANLESLDLNALDVKLNEKGNGILVDEFMRTSAENIYAVGDVTNIIQLAHVASHQGIVAVDSICSASHKIDYNAIPSAIFVSPEVGHVGLSEKAAKECSTDIIVSKFPFIANGKAIAMGESEGFVKLIADKNSKTILGGTIVGPHATDLMAVLSNLVAQKTTVEKAIDVIYAHPTSSESIHEALLMLEGKGIHFA